MSELKVDADPAELGFDPDRLARIDKHFARYVDDGLLAGWATVVTRDGRIAHASTHGLRDREADLPVDWETRWRIFSMTKPITSVAAMMLVEEGVLTLNDPISKFLPEFAGPRVYVRGSALNAQTVAATEPIRVWHLLTHTSGLTYGFHHVHPVDAMYRAAGYEWGTPPGNDLAANSEFFASVPLLFQPGTEWNYGVSTDVLGRLVEVASGQPLDEFFRTRIFAPLGMTETAFWLEGAELDQLAALYIPHPKTRKAVRNDAFGSLGKSRPDGFSGGGGLISTAADYHRFTQFILRGGELDGVRLLSPRTVAQMGSNHLPGGADLEQIGRPLFTETRYDGVGFGLGFSVLVNPVKAKTLASLGEIGWGGAASTGFWVDPQQRITALFFTQLLPSSTHPVRPEFTQLVYQSLLG
ncbi:MAG TPA: serine hydrolase domain-containing protein [Pseudonocardiaceae bacterium]|jgi:CubicO group peptidase (beta-lactamase class C family)|nr:serine hydrolase domain-containing protein [Pseudonocardiaceae bacterium]